MSAMGSEAGLSFSGSHDDPGFVFIVTFLVVLLMLIPIGNGFAIYLVLSRKRLQTITNWLVLSLAVSDITVALAVIPSTLACFQAECDQTLMKIVFDVFIFTSLSNLCVLTLDRYIAVMHPLRYHNTMTLGFVTKLVASSWIVPIFIFCAPLIWMYSDSSSEEFRTVANKVFYMTQIVLFISLPCLIMLLAYTCILRMAVIQSRRISNLEYSVRRTRSVSLRARARNSEAKNTIKVFGVVYLLFLFCWSLTAFATFVVYYKRESMPEKVIFISRICVVMNSCLNPLVYALWKKDFKTEVRIILRRNRRVRIDENLRSRSKAATVAMGMEETSVGPSTGTSSGPSSGPSTSSTVDRVLPEDSCAEAIATTAT